MSVHAKMVYDENACVQSRVRPDYDRVVNVDEDGDEKITWEMVDYPKIQSSLGSFRLWSLDALMKAGINPDFPIKTGFNTRLDGFGEMSSAVERINAIVDEEINKDKVE